MCYSSTEMYVIVDQIKNDVSKCFICAASFFSGVHSVGQSEKK